MGLFAEELCSQWPFRYKTCGEGMPTPLPVSPELERHEEQLSRSQHWMHFLFLLSLLYGGSVILPEDSPSALSPS